MNTQQYIVIPSEHRHRIPQAAFPQGGAPGEWNSKSDRKIFDKLTLGKGFDLTLLNDFDWCIYPIEYREVVIDEDCGLDQVEVRLLPCVDYCEAVLEDTQSVLNKVRIWMKDGIPHRDNDKPAIIYGAKVFWVRNGQAYKRENGAPSSMSINPWWWGDSATPPSNINQFMEYMIDCASAWSNKVECRPQRGDVIVRHLSNSVTITIDGDTYFARCTGAALGLKQAGEMALKKNVGLYIYDQDGGLIKSISRVDHRSQLE